MDFERVYMSKIKNNFSTKAKIFLQKYKKKQNIEKK